MPDSTDSDSLYLSDISPKDSSWDCHRNSTVTVKEHYSDSTDFKRYADRIEQCSRFLGFAFEAHDSGELTLRLRQARFCRVRLCPVCQWRRILMWRARFFQAIPKVLEAYPTGKWVFLTLTVKNCPLEELRDTLAAMNKAWVRLTQRKQFPALGFIKSVEITRAWDCYDGSEFLGRHGKTWVVKWEKLNGKKLRLEPTNEAHPHFHCLLLVPSSYFSRGYMKQSEWTELWRQALRVDYIPNVNVKKVKERPADTGNQALAIALLETLKYGIKESDLTSDSAWLIGLTTQLHKTRSVSVGGVLKQYITEDEPTDLIHVEGEEISESESESDTDIWFSWREVVKRYAKTER